MTRYRGRHRAPWIITVGPWVRRNPLVASVALILATWVPYGVADAHGLTEALRAPYGVAGTLLPPACSSEGGGEILPCRWECATMGNRQCGPLTPPRVIYRWDSVTGVIVCGSPGPLSEVCAEVGSEVPIEYVTGDGTLYRIVG